MPQAPLEKAAVDLHPGAVVASVRAHAPPDPLEEYAVKNKEEDLLAKGLGMAVALGAAWVAQQLVTQGWKRMLGHEPPKPENPGDSRFGEIAAAAMLSGAVVALARVFATRGAARFIK